MPHRICLIDGHPDPDPARFCHALARAYGEGAAAAGHELRRIRVADLDFPLLRLSRDFTADTVPPAIADVQEAILWADHVVVIYPLWHGMMPALLKGFFEQVFRHGFAMDVRPTGWTGHLTGRSARIIVTMGMPGLFYRVYFMAHSLSALRRNILGFSGMRPVRTTVLGRVDDVADGTRRTWLDRMRKLGADAR